MEDIMINMIDKSETVELVHLAYESAKKEQKVIIMLSFIPSYISCTIWFKYWNIVTLLDYFASLLEIREKSSLEVCC